MNRGSAHRSNPEVIVGVYRDCCGETQNLLSNLSPDTPGRLPKEAVRTMRQVGNEIRKRNRQSAVSARATCPNFSCPRPSPELHFFLRIISSSGNGRASA